MARAELAWWIARRVPGEDSPENVGRLLGEEYAATYGIRGEGVTRAGQLRARAAAVRDAEGAQADWGEMDRVLRASYRELHAAVAGGAR